jgi:hypothetical protein
MIITSLLGFICLRKSLMLTLPLSIFKSLLNGNLILKSSQFSPIGVESTENYTLIFSLKEYPIMSLAHMLTSRMALLRESIATLLK